MKKVLASILAAAHFTFSTSMGATVHLHYCMGKLFSWSLTDKDSKNCGHCGMPKSNMGGHCTSFKDGCCKDKQAHVQLDKDQKATEAAYTFLIFGPASLPGSACSGSGQLRRLPYHEPPHRERAARTG